MILSTFRLPLPPCLSPGYALDLDFDLTRYSYPLSLTPNYVPTPSVEVLATPTPFLAEDPVVQRRNENHHSNSLSLSLSLL